MVGVDDPFPPLFNILTISVEVSKWLGSTRPAPGERQSLG